MKCYLDNINTCTLCTVYDIQQDVVLTRKRSENSRRGFLGCDVIQCSLPPFRRIQLPLSSGWWWRQRYTASQPTRPRLGSCENLQTYIRL